EFPLQLRVQPLLFLHRSDEVRDNLLHFLVSQTVGEGLPPQRVRLVALHAADQASEQTQDQQTRVRHGNLLRARRLRLCSGCKAASGSYSGATTSSNSTAGWPL